MSSVEYFHFFTFHAGKSIAFYLLIIEHNNCDKMKLSSRIILTFILTCILFVVMYIENKYESGGNSGLLSGLYPSVEFPGNIIQKTNTKLDDVCGFVEIKQEVLQYIDYFKNLTRYNEIGCTLPRGLLFDGPPGCGKTLLAKAIATETDCTFISVDSNNFHDTYVGVGANKMKCLFKEARKHSPCIIFFDEIDAIGLKRSSINQNGEHTTVLNKLLMEMDGFNNNDNILVIGATNRVTELDPALLRSGRFDRKIVFDFPTEKERLDMFCLYCSKINNKQKIDFKLLAQRTVGCSGADIKNIVNQAAITFVQKQINKDKKQQNDSTITTNLLLDSIEISMIGLERKGTELSQNELKAVAHHEAGHAFIGHILKGASTSIKVSIVPRAGGVLGYCQPDIQDKHMTSKQHIVAEILVLMAGRCAEEILANNTWDISSGASDDMMKVSSKMRSLYSQFGLQSDGNRHMLVTQKDDISDSTQSKIDEQMINDCRIYYDLTKTILENNWSRVTKLANKLVRTKNLINTDLQKMLPKKLENSISLKKVFEYDQDSPEYIKYLKS